MDPREAAEVAEGTKKTISTLRASFVIHFLMSCGSRAWTLAANTRIYAKDVQTRGRDTLHKHTLTHLQ